MFKALDDEEDGDIADISDEDSDADEDDTFRPVRACGRGRGGNGGRGGRRRCLQVRSFSLPTLLLSMPVFASFDHYRKSGNGGMQPVI